MLHISSKLLILLMLPLMMLMVQVAFAATEDLGNGFFHHGVATPVSNHRGIVATVDGQGRDVALVWLFDHRGGYALLLIDAETGKSEEYPMPFPSGGDCPYASILSSANKFYTHFNSFFCEFDPVKRAFTFFQQTTPQMAMSMTEDDNGVIWSATYPNSGIVSFNPKTRELKDYGLIYKQNWAQYPRSIAADDTGWIYFGIGSTASQIIIFDPQTGQGKPFLQEAERSKGSGSVYRDMDGKVYGQTDPVKGGWIEFYKGEGKKIAKEGNKNPKPIISASQSLFHQQFPDGKRLKRCDTVERVMVVEDPKAGTSKQLTFDYKSEGAHIMGLAAAPDGTICGGTAFPMRCFTYNPKTDQWTNRESYGQWNTVARQGDHFFVGGYGAGFLLDWDPSKPWVPTVIAAGSPETIGWGYTGREHYHFKGMIDEVRIYNKALNPEELKKPTREGLVAHWSFDDGEGEIAKDSSGNGNHGKVHGAKWVEGKTGRALQLDGVNDYVEIPDSRSLHPQNAITVEAWIYPMPPHQQGYGGIMNNIAGHGNSRLLIGDAGNAMAQVTIGGSHQDVGGPSVNSNAWNHVVYIYDGSDEYFVVNGVEGTKHPNSGQIHLESNPRFLTHCAPTINRPHELLAHPDGKTLVLAGTPGYGYTGGGLLFWDRETKQRTLLEHTAILPEHSTMSMVALGGGKLLGGTTTSPGTGGEKKAEEAELYVMDMATKKVDWHAAVFPGVQGYTDLCNGPQGLVYGIADQRRFFVFDPLKKQVVHEEDASATYGPTTSQQGPRVFVTAPDKTIYILFVKGIARIDPKTYEITMLAESPIPIGPGGDILNGSIYFGSGSHVYSYRVPK